MLRSDNPSSFFFVELDNFGANCLMSVGDLVEGFKISGEIGIIDGFHPISNKGVHPVATVFVDVIGHEGFRTFCAGCSVVAGMNLPYFS